MTETAREATTNAPTTSTVAPDQGVTNATRSEPNDETEHTD